MASRKFKRFIRKAGRTIRKHLPSIAKKVGQGLRAAGKEVAKIEKASLKTITAPAEALSNLSKGLSGGLGLPLLLAAAGVVAFVVLRR
jgi:hypothetical protein